MDISPVHQVGPKPLIFARHGERGKKTRQTEAEVGRQYQGMDRPEFRQVQEGNGQQGEMEETVKSSVVPQQPPRLKEGRN